MYIELIEIKNIRDKLVSKTGDRSLVWIYF